MSSLLFTSILLLNIYKILTFGGPNCNHSELLQKTFCEIYTLPISNMELYLETKSEQLELQCKSKQSTAIPSNKFVHIQHVQYLTIKNCVFDEIQDGAFNGLKELKEISIHQEYHIAININENIFDPTPKLEVVELNMGIYQMPKEIFCNLKQLGIIDLSGNQLRHITEIGCGKNNSCCSNVWLLDLSHNHLTRIDSIDLSFENLVKLDLSFNKIEYFKISYYDPLSLRLFNISNNKLFQPRYLSPYFPVHLQSIHLSFNPITFLSHTFEEVLDVNNNLNAFKEAIDVKFKNLNSVYLIGSQIRNVPVKFLKFFPHLTYLSLSSNLLERIDCSKCMFLQRLHHLDVTNNSLLTIPELPSTDLRSLLLDSNQITDSNETIPYKNLTSLHLSRNRLKVVPDVHLLSKLELLDLSFNAICYIPANSFIHLKGLLRLYMGGNRIKTIGEDVLKPFLQSTMVDVDFQSNNLSSIGNMPKKVYNLLLQDNKLTTFNFSIAVSYVSINVSNNKIEAIIFDNDRSKKCCPGLKYFYASNNQLHNFTSVQPLFLLPQIQIIELANNNISCVEKFDYSISKSLDVVDLRNNSISDVFEFKLHPWLQIDLRYNPIACTCINDWLLLDNLNNPKVKILLDGHCIVQYHRIKKITSQLEMLDKNKRNMLCEDIENCPSQCVCFYNLKIVLYIVDCFNVSWKYPWPMLPSNATTIFLDDNNNLASVVGDLLMNCSMLQTIYMNNSGLVNINKEMFLGVPELIELHLENNCISQINGNEFNFTTELEILYMHQNLLEFLSRNAFQELKKLKNLTLHENRLVQPELWLIFQHGLEITLSRNPFKCDCHFALSFQQWVANSREMKFEDLNETFCSETTTVLLLDFYALKCLDRDEVNEALIIAPTVSISCFFIIVAILIYLYRIEMKVWLYSRYGVRLFHNNKNADIGKEYDAFISYANEDDEWVNEILVPKLNEYKLCLHQRDFPVGEYIVESIVNAVENSCRTVIILTPNYIKSLWCRFEFDTAHTQSLQDKCKRLVVVVLEEVPKDEMDKNLHAYMKTNTYLHIKNSLFWSKLKYALPDVKVRNTEEVEPTAQTLELENNQNSA